MTIVNWAEADRLLAEAHRILVVTHMHPDGDAIGSLLGLTLALRDAGKNVDAAVDEGVPPFLRYLVGWDTVLGQLDTGEWDVMISVDASDEVRTGTVGAYGRAHSRIVINLDHHPTNTMFGQAHLVVPTAVSAAEIVLEWLTLRAAPLTLPIAMALMTGLVTDTLGFRTPNVHVGTLALAQRLMEAGASLAEITARTLVNKPYSMVELWKYVLPSVVLDQGVIYATVTQEDFKRAGFDPNAEVGMVNFLLAVDEAVVSATFKETDKDEVAISLRAELGFDVSLVALSLGGGGHKQASGATVPGTLEEVKARVLPMLYKAVKSGKLVYS